MKHIYQSPYFGENWFQQTSETLIKKAIESTSSGGKFVEIGSWKGKSSAFTVVEIINSKKNIEFHCVDTWEGGLDHKNYPNLERIYDIFTNNMKPFKDYYKPIRMNSIDASNLYDDKSLDFIFIDASHEYEDVKNDIISWIPKLKDTGIIGGDDYGNLVFPGVKKAVDEVFNHKAKNDGMTWFYSKMDNN